MEQTPSGLQLQKRWWYTVSQQCRCFQDACSMPCEHTGLRLSGGNKEWSSLHQVCSCRKGGGIQCHSSAGASKMHAACHVNVYRALSQVGQQGVEQTPSGLQLQKRWWYTVSQQCRCFQDARSMPCEHTGLRLSGGNKEWSRLHQVCSCRKGGGIQCHSSAGVSKMHAACHVNIQGSVSGRATRSGADSIRSAAAEKVVVCSVTAVQVFPRCMHHAM